MQLGCAKAAAPLSGGVVSYALLSDRYSLGHLAWICHLARVKTVSTSLALPRSTHRAWWLWPNVLSLDAPVIALVWQEAFAQVLMMELGWVPRVILAVCTWLAYCGDRLLDARRLPAGPVQSARHTFAHRHSRRLIIVWVTAVVLAALLGLQLPVREIIFGSVWLMVLGGYFLLQHASPFRAKAGRWKEPVAGTVFALGVLFFVALRVESISPGMILAALAWAGLCALNCLTVAGWDRELDAAMNQPSLARSCPGLERALPWLGLVVAALALGAAVWEGRWLPLALATTVSALALLELARRPGWVSAEIRRVWADAVLLTPVCFLF